MAKTNKRKKCNAGFFFSVSEEYILNILKSLYFYLRRRICKLNDWVNYTNVL